jgi:hypothetical protein
VTAGYQDIQILTSLNQRTRGRTRGTPVDF